jgi:hypothetical protein
MAGYRNCHHCRTMIAITAAATGAVDEAIASIEG